MADPGALGPRRDRGKLEIVAGVGRRAFLTILALFVVGRALWAQGRRRVRYRPLTRPVLVPLASLATPGRARRFVAEGVSPASAATPGGPVRIRGMVARIAEGDAPERFKAVCVVCPHEQCDVDFVADPTELAPAVVEEIGELTDPIYLCPCHNSTFTMAEGVRLGGPAPRGLYQFRVTGVTGTHVEIGEVEEDVLLFF